MVVVVKTLAAPTLPTLPTLLLLAAAAPALAMGPTAPFTPPAAVAVVAPAAPVTSSSPALPAASTAASAAAADQTTDAGLSGLSGLRLAGAGSAALIDGRWWPLGSQPRGARLVAVQRHQVQLRHANGQLEWLPLNPAAMLTFKVSPQQLPSRFPPNAGTP